MQNVHSSEFMVGFSTASSDLRVVHDICHQWNRENSYNIRFPFDLVMHVIARLLHSPPKFCFTTSAMDVICALR